MKFLEGRPLVTTFLILKRDLCVGLRRPDLDD